jgi:methanethiol S-methyltransferase
MPRETGRSIGRSIIAVAGGLVFAASLLYFAAQYLRGFDAPPASDNRAWPSLVVNLVLFSLFALHHSMFARTGLKAIVQRAITPELERSFYVWVASLLFVMTCAFWQPLPGVVWEAHGWPEALLRGVQATGALFTLVAARHLDALELAGVRQALELPAKRPSGLDDHGPYGLVRHPIYLAWMLFVWAAPDMNGTRVAFAAVSSIYLVVAIRFEERDLRRTFGAAYDRYAQKVRWKLIPGAY